jgi:hypothetical protein
MTPEEGPDPSRLFSIFLELTGTSTESGEEREISNYINGI